MRNNISNKLLLITLILLVFILNVTGQSLAKKTEGLITEISLKEKRVKLGEVWYKIEGNTEIIRNGIPCSLEAIGPVAPGFYQFAEINYDNRGKVSYIKVDYHVIEGIVKNISRKEGWFQIKIYRNEVRDMEEEKIFWYDDQIKGLQDLKPGVYLIAVTGLNRLIKIVGIEEPIY